MPRVAPRFPYLAAAALLGAMVSLSLGTSFAKTLFPAVGAQGANFLRLLFSAAILSCVCRPWRHAWPAKRELRMIVLYGITIGAMTSCFYLSLRTIPFGIATALEFTGPLAVAVLSARRRSDYLWAALAAVGLLLLLPLRANVAHLDVLGVMFALGAGTFWALYIAAGKRASKGNAGQVAALGMVVGALLVAPITVASSGLKVFEPAYLTAGLAVGLLSGALPFGLEMLALQRLPKRTFSIMLSAEPALSALAGLVLLGEQLHLLQWLAVACVIAASIGSASAATAEPPAIG